MIKAAEVNAEWISLFKEGKKKRRYVDKSFEFNVVALERCLPLSVLFPGGMQSVDFGIPLVPLDAELTGRVARVKLGEPLDSTGFNTWMFDVPAEFRQNAHWGHSVARGMALHTTFDEFAEKMQPFVDQLIAGVERKTKRVSLELRAEFASIYKESEIGDVIYRATRRFRLRKENLAFMMRRPIYSGQV